MTIVLISIGLLVLASVGLIVWLKYKDSHNESVEQPLKWEAGQWYMCIKDGVFGGFPDGDTFFKKGEVYYCDEQGIVDHNNQNFHEDFANDNFSEYFRLATEDEIPTEDVDEPEKPTEPTEEPIVEEPQTPNEPEEPKDEEPEVDVPKQKFDDVIAYFSQVVPIGKKTREYIWNLRVSVFLEESLFPCVYNYYGEKKNDYGYDQNLAWVIGLILSELSPENRQQIIQMAYDYKVKGANQPTYGYTFETDPNVTRIFASAVYSITRNPEIIPELRRELGSKMVSYKNDVSELFIDLTKFMPTAPFPFLDAYTYRPKGLPVNATETADMDEEIHKHICQYYNLDTKDAEKRQRTIQAIADKEYKKPHLFGKPRAVVDPKYGEMTFYPVFGKHNIGVEIDPNGKIAELCYSIGRICTDGRKSLLNQEYGRRRPGQGESDPSANADPKQRALCNHTIEENDGHSTGYYEKNGNYVNVDTGQVIDDYDTYCQGLLYANSYISGHSDLIMAVGMVLMMIMPDKADLILKALNEFANSRTICRYHWTSDTIHGRVAGSTMVPILAACTNIEFDKKLKEAIEEYLNPKPQPTEKGDIWWHKDIDGGKSPYVTCAACGKGFDVEGWKNISKLY